jgi:hypothetical protein
MAVHPSPPDNPRGLGWGRVVWAHQATAPSGAVSASLPHRPVRGGASHCPRQGAVHHTTAVGSGVPPILFHAIHSI